MDIIVQALVTYVQVGAIFGIQSLIWFPAEFRAAIRGSSTYEELPQIGKWVVVVFSLVVDCCIHTWYWPWVLASDLRSGGWFGEEKDDESGASNTDRECP